MDRRYRILARNSRNRKLEEWQRETEDQGNRHLGMPRIGSGLDQLNWKKVLEMINEIFYYNDVVITIKDGK